MGGRRRAGCYRQAGDRNKTVAREEHRGTRFLVGAVAWHNPVMGAQHRQDFRSDETLVDICNHGRPRAAAACVLVVALFTTKHFSERDSAPVYADIDGSGQVDIADVLALARAGDGVGQAVPVPEGVRYETTVTTGGNMPDSTNETDINIAR